MAPNGPLRPARPVLVFARKAGGYSDFQEPEVAVSPGGEGPVLYACHLSRHLRTWGHRGPQQSCDFRPTLGAACGHRPASGGPRQEGQTPGHRAGGHRWLRSVTPDVPGGAREPGPHGSTSHTPRPALPRGPERALTATQSPATLRAGSGPPAGQAASTGLQGQRHSARHTAFRHTGRGPGSPARDRLSRPIRSPARGAHWGVGHARPTPPLGAQT